MIDIVKIRKCSYLLPDPGGEVVRELLNEIEKGKEFEQWEIFPNDLLAIIHRDGGHHTQEVGEKQSIVDAIQVWVDRQVEIERLKIDLAGFEAGAQAEADAGDEARIEVKQLQTKIEQLEQKYSNVLNFMDGVRDIARNRNPGGVTILDFMSVWNEQYENRIKQQQDTINEYEKIIVNLAASIK